MIEDDIAAVWQRLAATDTGTFACVFDKQLIGLKTPVEITWISVHNSERPFITHIDAGEITPAARQIADATRLAKSFLGFIFY